MSGDAPFRLDIVSPHFTDKEYVEYIDGVFHMCQMEEECNMNIYD